MTCQGCDVCFLRRQREKQENIIQLFYSFAFLQSLVWKEDFAEESVGRFAVLCNAMVSMAGYVFVLAKVFGEERAFDFGRLAQQGLDSHSSFFVEHSGYVGHLGHACRHLIQNSNALNSFGGFGVCVDALVGQVEARVVA